MGKTILAVALLSLGAFLTFQGAAAPPSTAPQDGQRPAAAQKTAQAVDPVCGMTVDPAKAAGKSEHKGTTYYFCSDYCKRKFDASPDTVLKKSAAKK